MKNAIKIIGMLSTVIFCLASVKVALACPTCPGGAQLVYIQGNLGTSFDSEEKKNSFTQNMKGASLSDYLEENPWDAQNLFWTLNKKDTPIYVISPQGPFASVIYERLRKFLADNPTEAISIAGYIGGTAKLISGEVVPVIIPEVRSMHSSAEIISKMHESAEVSKDKAEMIETRIRAYLAQIDSDYINLGSDPRERALNFVSMDPSLLTPVLVTEMKEDKPRILDKIIVEKSPLCRPDSHCYDIKMSFFDQDKNPSSSKIYRWTVDVEEVLPVLIGRVRVIVPR